MSLYTDENCGIEVPHRHTGEIVQGHFVEYFCPSLTAWISKDDSYGNKCSCQKPHMKARVQTTETELIDILVEVNGNYYSNELVSYIREELSARFQVMFWFGEEIYNDTYRGE